MDLCMAVIIFSNSFNCLKVHCPLVQTQVRSVSAFVSSNCQNSWLNNTSSEWAKRPTTFCEEQPVGVYSKHLTQL